MSIINFNSQTITGTVDGTYSKFSVLTDNRLNIRFHRYGPMSESVALSAAYPSNVEHTFGVTINANTQTAYGHAGYINFKDGSGNAVYNFQVFYDDDYASTATFGLRQYDSSGTFVVETARFATTVGSSYILKVTQTSSEITLKVFSSDGSTELFTDTVATTEDNTARTIESITFTNSQQTQYDCFVDFDIYDFNIGDGDTDIVPFLKIIGAGSPSFNLPINISNSYRLLLSASDGAVVKINSAKIAKVGDSTDYWDIDGGEVIDSAKYQKVNHEDRIVALETEVGDSSTLDTTSKEVVGAINEVHGDITANASNISSNTGKVSNNETDINALQKALALNMVMRDTILDTRMRLTGLNFGTNVWTDSLLNTDGLNLGSCVTYEYENAARSLGVDMSGSYSAEFDCSVKPSEADDTWIEDGTGTMSIVDGALHLVTSTGQYTEYKKFVSIDPAHTKKIQVRARITSGGDGGQEGVNLAIMDGTKLLSVYISTNSIRYLTAAATYSTVETEGTGLSSEYIDIILKFNSTDGADITIGGQSWNIPYSGMFSTSGSDYVEISSGGSTTMDYSYISFTENIDTEATLMWKGVTSSAVLNSFSIDGIVTGTGSATFSVSRDNGTTWTECSLASATDISTQPSGTDVIVKAVISGDTEILGIAFGGVE